MDRSDGKLGLQGAWSMAVGGMVGGGIFSTLGVVIGIAGGYAWLSFLIAGLVALLAGYSYTQLALRYGEGGGAFTFLREIHEEGFAGSLAWILIIGYVLTNAVYAHTFGAYLDHLIPLGPVGSRLSAAAVILFFVAVNLRGAGEAGGIEIFLVWFKLIVLFGLAAFGLMRWEPALLSQGAPEAGIGQAIFGAAAVFMAYEGFQLLTYDYDEIDEPRRTLPRATFYAITLVIVVYIAVALGTPMLVGAEAVIEHEEVALSLAGRAALGTAGLILVSVAAAFSTGSAINATLFATARLSFDVVRAGELPEMLEHRNRHQVPDRAVIALGLLAAVLATFGTLSALVEAASLAFLFTFCTVSGIAFFQKTGSRLLTGCGALGAGLATGALALRLFRTAPGTLLGFTAIVVLAVVGRPLIIRHSRSGLKEP